MIYIGIITQGTSPPSTKTDYRRMIEYINKSSSVGRVLPMKTEASNQPIELSDRELVDLRLEILREILRGGFKRSTDDLINQAVRCELYLLGPRTQQPLGTLGKDQ